ncbi:MAG: glycosyltransferase family 39 protein, partial [Acidobacteriota bacterium]|nr:glycosyltransferase family 39 protein [Acidobacteriota bacterium]
GCRQRLPPLPRFWKWLFAAVFLPFAIYYFVNALAPESSPDGSSYHLGLVARYLRQRGFGHITNSMFANLSQGMEMLFLFAFGIGRHSAAALVHFAYLLVLPMCMVCYARRFKMPAAGVFGALLIFTSPIFAIDGTSAYNDVGAACVIFTCFYLLQIWLRERQAALLIPVGLLAGFAFGIKYTAAPAVPYAVLLVLWTLRRSGRRALRAIVPVLLCAALMAGPWLIKNWIVVSNPVSPFLNSVFPNPYTSIALEKDYFRANHLPEGFSPMLRVWDLTVRGGTSIGSLGPFFLLAPLALLAVRYPAGWQLLIAAAVFSVTALGNYQTRFLIPAAPFLALAIGVALSHVRAALPVLVMINAAVCWPSMVGSYCDAGNWRLRDFPLRQALRIEPEEAFLSSRLPDYDAARLIDRLVAVGGRVFSFGRIPDAYTSREVIVSAESSANLKMRDLLWIPLMPDLQPAWKLAFSFPAQRLRRIRVIQTNGGSDNWSVSEFRIFHGSDELARRANWRLTAHPNPWDVQLAFDADPITRWNSQEVLHPGMFMEVDLNTPEEIDSVALECSHDQWGVRLELQGQDATGNWKILAGKPDASDQPIRVNLRRAATRALKAQGVTHLLVNNEDYTATDFRGNASDWSIHAVATTSSSRLYQID